MESFIARLWLERGPDDEPMWRGHIQHVQSDREGYFQDLSEMREFLQSVTGAPGPELTGWPKKRTGGDIS